MCMPVEKSEIETDWVSGVQHSRSKYSNNLTNDRTILDFM